MARQTYEKYVAGLRSAVFTSDDGRYLAYANYDRLVVHDRSTQQIDTYPDACVHQLSVSALTSP